MDKFRIVMIVIGTIASARFAARQGVKAVKFVAETGSVVAAAHVLMPKLIGESK